MLGQVAGATTIATFPTAVGEKGIGMDLPTAQAKVKVPALSRFDQFLAQQLAYFFSASKIHLGVELTILLWSYMAVATVRPTTTLIIPPYLQVDVN